MVNDIPKNETIFVQRLYLENHFDEILKYNLQNLDDWENVYPNHSEWISKAVKELKGNNYERIAFGGFFINKRRKPELCSSAIVKKNPFTPYLEIKNLICFKFPQESYSTELESKYKEQMIKHIRGYAEQRGFPKLVTELVNKDAKDKELIRTFLKNDFIIAGNHYNRYKEQDDIVYLISEVNPIYGYDPYDNFSLTEWILSKYLDCHKIEKSKTPKVNVTYSSKATSERLEFAKKVYDFYIGDYYEDKIKSKFNNKARALVLEEYITQNKELKAILGINHLDDFKGQSFVFDYTQEKLIDSLSFANHTLFNREEINQLIEIPHYNTRQNRFSYSDVGGFLLISNKERFPFDILYEQVRKGITSIYIKLGSVGKYVTPEMPLYFAYYPSKLEKSTLKIWGKAELLTDPQPINLLKCKEDISKEIETDDQVLSLGDYLFHEVKNEEESPLWSIKDFDQHNSYNATNTVVCFSFKDILFLEEEEEIDLEDCLEDKDYLEDLENVFDFYLSKNEVNNFEKILERVIEKRALSERSKSNIPQELSSKNEQQMKGSIDSSELKDGMDKMLDEIVRLKNKLEFKLSELKAQGEENISLSKKTHLYIDTLKITIDEKEITTSKKIKEQAEKTIATIIELKQKHSIENEEIDAESFAKLSTSARLKLTIPIIPYILTYESDLLEFGSEIKIKSWKDILKAFTKAK